MEIYMVANRTASMAFAKREDAEKVQGSAGAAVGMEIIPIQVFGAEELERKGKALDSFAKCDCMESTKLTISNGDGWSIKCESCGQSLGGYDSIFRLFEDWNYINSDLRKAMEADSGTETP